jgi:hypothetical protein
MARLRLGAVSLAALLIVVAATSIAGAAVREPRFSDSIAHRVPEDPFRLVGSDLNGDAKADLVTVNWNSSSVSVLLSRGDGNFAKRIDYRAPRHPAGLAVADVNGDRQPDLITAGHNPAGSVAIWLNRGGGRFVRGGTYAAGPNAWAVAAADINGDGTVDLLTAHHGRQQLAVLVGIGDGRFHGAQRYAGPGASDLAVADLSRDGVPDVVLAIKEKNQLAVRLGRGDGSFGDPRRYKIGGGVSGIALADFNHDQVLDVASGAIMLGNGDGTLRLGWRDEEGSGLGDVAAGDFNGDGNPDLLTSGYPPDVLLGSGDGRLHSYEVEDEEAGVLGVDAAGRSGAAPDFNGDGRPDLALIALCDYDCDFGTVLVWLNWTGLPAKPCVVPDVSPSSYEEWPLREAAHEFRSSGCQLGQVRRRFSRKVGKGSVVSQRPKPGTVLPSHGSVDVVISRGRHRRAR